MKRFLKILLKSFIGLIILIVFLLAGFYISIHYQGVQLFLTKKISGYLSDKIQSTVSVSAVDFKLFSTFTLEGVYIEAQNGDTLAYINEFNAELDRIDLDNNKIFLAEIELNKFFGNLKLDTSGTTNIQFIIDAFATDSPPDTLSKSWSIDCHNFKLNSSRFAFKADDSEQKSGINFLDLSLTNLNADIENLQLIGDSITFSLNKFGFIEKSGFILHEVSGDALYCSNQTEFKNLKIRTDNSWLKLELANLKYNSPSDFKDFINNIKINLILEPSKVNTKDIAYFATFFDSLDFPLEISGNFKGTISNLRGKNIKIFFGNQSRFRGDFQIQGIPDVNEIFIIADATEFITTKEDIENIQIPPYNNKKYIKLPKNLSSIGKIKYHGNFTGFLNDFVAYGELNTGIGNVFTDISIKNDSAKQCIYYNGKVRAKNINLSKLTNNNEKLGNVSLNINVKAESYQNNKPFHAIIDGTVKSIEFNKYDYNDIIVNGEITGKKYDGAISINDENVKLEFLGRVDFTDTIPEFDFTADVSKLNLFKLNFEKKDSLTNTSFLLNADFNGDNIDNIEGYINFYNVNIENSRRKDFFNEIVLNITKNENVKQIKLKSDIIDLDINGNYQLSDLSQSMLNIINKYIPSFAKLNTNKDKLNFTNSFDYKIKIHNVNNILYMYYPELSIAKNTVINGKFESDSKDFDLQIISDSISYINNKFKALHFASRTKNDVLSAYLEADTLFIYGIKLEEFMINSEVFNDSIQFNSHWLNNDSLRFSGDITFTSLFKEKTNSKIPILNVYLKQSNISISDNKWDIAPTLAIIDSTSIKIEDFKISNNLQELFINGNIAENKTDSLFINFKNINLNAINTFISSENLKIGGILNGDAILSDVYKNLIFHSNLKVDSLLINNEQLGNFNILSGWNNESKKINLHASTMRGTLRTFNLEGEYSPSENDIDFVLKLDKLRLNIFDPYLENILTDLRGIASGEIKITGKPTEPDLKGDISLQKTSFTVDYLQTRYNFSNSIHITKNKFELNDMKVFDIKGNTTIVNGTITHDNFKNFNFDIVADAEKFQFLNTTEKDNSLFYGTAYATGLINVEGTPENINIDIIAKTDKNTKFHIPLTSGEDISETNFIKFVNKNTINETIKPDYKVDLSGIKLNFDLEATPDAEVQIILDSKVGDIIKVKGNGDIKMEINTLGNFNIYGEYIIDDGDYLFTLQNIINKKFNVEKGSSIKWNGSPYDAYVDINAIYRLKAALYDLVLDTSDTYKKRIPVECYLKMTNNITNPTIDFDVFLPIPDDKANTQLKSLTEEEMNKQILSLLVLNRFYTPDNLRGTQIGNDNKGSGNAVGANSSELLSNQLSHWLSQISNDFDLGVNYRPGDEISSDELEVALSTQILNDRVNINGNVGVGGNKTSNSSGIVGDVNVDVKINKSGKLRVKGFTKTNDNTIYESSSVQGIGMFYKEEFNTIGELYRRYMLKFKRKDN
ncbi:MAG: hypothetical protein A2033_11825 [Bacteroidetes bacterium GWA2_31_9]|nr:MAG: hypothetical protein A2033_11825 [Bacteroidetes bacterium GWA2_31_9]